MALDSNPDWWRDAAVYQIYPRSFADSNGDGIGDLPGITSRLPYLKRLGVDAVWLSPFYPSALADGGYDVDDYCDVDPRIGTLEQFDQMVRALHQVGIRVIVDIVPNHSGSGHAWFRAALASPAGSAERARYIFRSGLGPEKSQPPSDWTATFGGSTWEPVGDGEFYFHLFDRSQPDWNWDNPEVQAEFKRILRFWADRGVDGFRVDVANALAKDFSADPLADGERLAEIPSGPDHPFYDRDEVHQIYAGWREVFDSYDPPRAAVGEVWVDDPARRARYATPAGLGQAFNFDLLLAGFDADEFEAVIQANLSLAAVTGSSSTWVLSNHDVIRHASRYGLPDPANPSQRRDTGRHWLLSKGQEPAEDVALGLARARAATLAVMALPGSVYLYQGEELGLREVADLPDAVRQDPVFRRSPGYDVGRDGARVPLPWQGDGPSLGFGSGLAHLPQPDWFRDYAAAVEADDPDSVLNFYRRALAARRDLLARTDVAASGFEWISSPAGTSHWTRGPWHCLINFTRLEGLDLPPGRLLVSSERGGPAREELRPATAAWLLV
ncbi:MAG: glycoside hydrolase family 13 protein [Bifidobacteriaceae bacterium]|jgi:alpha-glucosidase|nr:glycoside hydrolase family 13 protein [Bifidobacteriaceae bacterium]